MKVSRGRIVHGKTFLFATRIIDVIMLDDATYVTQKTHFLNVQIFSDSSDVVLVRKYTKKNVDK